MSFDDTCVEVRERFVEAHQLLSLLTPPEPPRPATNTDKALRGLVLVSIYAAVERAINSTVEQAIYEISSHETPSIQCAPGILSLFHYGKIQAMKDCNYENTITKATALLSSAFSNEVITMSSNPIASILQNVDAKTMLSVAKFFGINDYNIDEVSIGRLNNLRERRNAVSHGRESASSAGERFNISELRSIYNCADSEVNRFIGVLREHCTSRRYINRDNDNVPLVRRSSGLPS